MASLVKNIIGGFVALVVGVTLAPTVADTIAGAVGGNITGTDQTLLELVTTLFIIAIMMAAVNLL